MFVVICASFFLFPVRGLYMNIYCMNMFLKLESVQMFVLPMKSLRRL